MFRTVRVENQPDVDKFMENVYVLVSGTEGLYFGSPSSGRQQYRDHSSIPTPIDLIAEDVDNPVSRLEKALGIVLNRSNHYKSYKGQKIIEETTGTKYAIDIYLWDNSIGAADI